MVGRSLPALALALVALAAVLLPIGIARHCRTTDAPPARPGPTPNPPPRDDALVAAMFAAVCRHEVGCGVGDLTRCDYVEDTMRKMPAELAIRPCALDPVDARACIAELATRNCKDATTSLDVLALQTALDRIRSCRRACAATASSP